jgi:hypothetical protein
MMPGQTCTVSPDTNGGPQYNQPPPFTENHFGSNIPIAWPRGYTVYYVEYSGNYTGYFSSFPLDYIAAITTAYSSWGDADNNSLLNYDYYGTTISGLNNARSNGNSTFQPWHEWIIVYQADLGAGVVGDTNSAWQNYGSNAVPIWAVGTAVSRVSNAMSLDFDDVSYSASTFAHEMGHVEALKDCYYCQGGASGTIMTAAQAFLAHVSYNITGPQYCDNKQTRQTAYP